MGRTRCQLSSPAARVERQTKPIAGDAGRQGDMGPALRCRKPMG